jgi:FkbM family methyltransferase
MSRDTAATAGSGALRAADAAEICETMTADAMNYSSPFLLTLRRIGQQFGVLRPLVKLYRSLLNKTYEDNFDKLMMSTITAGSVVWDIGANVGFYSDKFLRKVGPMGYVVAFEPAPRAAEICTQKFLKEVNFKLENKGLSNKSGIARFLAESTSPTNKIIDSINPSAVDVEVITGDQFIHSNPSLDPNFIKLDVEGFEPEVLEGLNLTLRNPKFKALFLEMHFLELVKRGKGSAPTEIVALLESASLKIKWVDPSHLIAYR